jgi:hypothetical protein
MPSDPKFALGTLVRLLPDGYIRLLMLPSHWTGTLVGMKHSEFYCRTEYLLHLDERFQPEEDFYIREDEIKQCAGGAAGVGY